MLLANVLIEGLLQVLALIGIILTAGFLIFFLGDLLLAILDPKYNSVLSKQRRKQKKEELEFSEEPKQIEYSETEEEELEPEDTGLLLQNVDYDKASSEEAEMLGEETEENPMAALREEDEMFKQESYRSVQERFNTTSRIEDLFSEEDDDDFFGDEITEEESSDETELRGEDIDEIRKQFEAAKNDLINKLKEEEDWDD